MKDTKLWLHNFILFLVFHTFILFGNNYFFQIASLYLLYHFFKEDIKLQVFTFAFPEKLRNYSYFPFIYITFTSHFYLEYY